MNKITVITGQRGAGKSRFCLELLEKVLGRSCPCDVLFIDELGPLEFDKGEGYTEAFPVLKSGAYGQAYVVIRPECLESFRRIIPEFGIIMIEDGTCITGPRI